MCYTTEIKALDDIIHASCHTIFKEKFSGYVFKFSESQYPNTYSYDAVTMILEFLDKSYVKELREYFSQAGLNLYIIHRLNNHATQNT